jgi:hypothetical protein
MTGFSGNRYLGSFPSVQDVVVINGQTAIGVTLAQIVER